MSSENNKWAGILLRDAEEAKSTGRSACATDGGVSQVKLLCGAVRGRLTLVKRRAQARRGSLFNE
jgi:hypothetical protein